MRRRFVAGDVERLVKELVVGHVVADDHLVRFRSLAPSANPNKVTEKTGERKEIIINGSSLHTHTQDNGNVRNRRRQEKEKKRRCQDNFSQSV